MTNYEWQCTVNVWLSGSLRQHPVCFRPLMIPNVVASQTKLFCCKEWKYESAFFVINQIFTATKFSHILQCPKIFFMSCECWPLYGVQYVFTSNHPVWSPTVWNNSSPTYPERSCSSAVKSQLKNAFILEFWFSEVFQKAGIILVRHSDNMHRIQIVCGCVNIPNTRFVIKWLKLSRWSAIFWTICNCSENFLICEHGLASPWHRYTTIRFLVVLWAKVSSARKVLGSLSYVH